jgi:hypothetical protein
MVGDQVITVTAMWCLLVVLPTTYFGWSVLHRLKGAACYLPPSLGSLIVLALGLVGEVVGIVVWESPFLFYSGISVILLLEAHWTLKECGSPLEGTRLISYRVWMGIVALLPVLSAGAGVGK